MGLKLTKKARASRKEYYREWRRKNPEKVQAIQQRYWEKRIALSKEKQPGEDQKGEG